MGRPTYIAVAGNIGCGKSTLVDFICRTYEVEPFFEPNARNPFLVDFYADMKRWAFHSQLFFLTQKFRIHQDLDLRRTRQTVVQDRTIFEDAEIFAANLHQRGFINKRDWGLYQDFYQTALRAIEPPDLLIYLRASIRTIRKRIKIRARPEEQQIPVTYLRALNRLYESWFASYKRSPTLVLESDRLDYITDLIDRIDILKTIEKYI
ncbi:MAG: deoxynucleoside kinase [Pseudomonadota bacterium]